MEPKGIEVVASMFLAIAIVSNVAVAQQGCMSQLISMSSCLNYVSGSASTPPPSCCTALANVVKTQPRCLCTIVNGDGSSLGVTINQTLALGLPSACQVETPPSSKCNVVNGPAMSPVGSPESAPPESGDGGGPASSTTPSVTAASPSDSPTSSPDSPNTGSGDGGSKTVPTGDGFSDATSNKMGVIMFVSVLFVTSYVSVFTMA